MIRVEINLGRLRVAFEDSYDVCVGDGPRELSGFASAKLREFADQVDRMYPSPTAGQQAKADMLPGTDGPPLPEGWVSDEALHARMEENRLRIKELDENGWNTGTLEP